jgi:hypothetical protein
MDTFLRFNLKCKIQNIYKIKKFSNKNINNKTEIILDNKIINKSEIILDNKIINKSEIILDNKIINKSEIIYQLSNKRDFQYLCKIKNMNNIYY